jgi:hypothetical protein
MRCFINVKNVDGTKHEVPEKWNEPQVSWTNQSVIYPLKLKYNEFVMDGRNKNNIHGSPKLLIAIRFLFNHILPAGIVVLLIKELSNTVLDIWFVLVSNRL